MGLPNIHTENMRQSCCLGQERKFQDPVQQKHHVFGVPSSLSCPACRELLVPLLAPSGHSLLALAPTGHKVAGDSLHPSPQIKLNWQRFYWHRCSLLKSICFSNSFFHFRAQRRFVWHGFSACAGPLSYPGAAPRLLGKGFLVLAEFWLP